MNDVLDRWNVPVFVRTRKVEGAREFRKEPAQSEDVLWCYLRGRKLEGRKLRRQQPIGPFIVDFFCAEERLIVEVDGAIHEMQREADANRQCLLERLGLRFVRVGAEAVETNISSVLDLIRRAYRKQDT